MLRKIESTNELWYVDDKLDLYVNYQDPTQFVFTDKSLIPLVTFTCNHDSIDDIQDILDQVVPKALGLWDKLHKIQDQRDRISNIATDKNINIILDNVPKFS